MTKQSTIEVIQGLAEKLYRARPETSQTTLKKFLAPTPAHAIQAIKDDEEKDEEKDNLVNGSCLHALTLEKKVIFEVALKCTTKKNPKQPEDGILLSPHNAAAVRGMAAGIVRNKDCMTLLDAVTQTEISVFWDGWKARIDAVCPLGILDIKSTAKGADEWEFSKAIQKFGYHIQAAMYLEAAAKAGFPCEDFYFLAVESFPPFEANVHRLKHEAIEVGRVELERLRKIYHECKESGNYPGYVYNPDGISLPSWKMKQIENGEE